MLTIDLDRFMFELKGGAIKHVGASNKRATVKLYDVAEDPGVREFGDERIKLVFEDDDGSEVEIAVAPEQATSLRRSLAEIEDESPQFD